eukprot:gene27526-36219_t
MNKLPRYTSNSLKPHPKPGYKWGLDIKPGLPSTVLGEKYCLCAVDFGSGATIYFPMKHKDQLVTYIDKLLNLVKQYQSTIMEIHCFQTDDEAIFVGGDFPSYCSENHIQLQFSSPYIKEQNGLIESAIKTDFATARTMILNDKVKQYLWSHAIRYAAYIRFRTIGSRNYGKNLTAYFLWFGTHPDVSNLRTWGSPAYHHIPDELQGKTWYLTWNVTERSDVVILESIPNSNPLLDPHVIGENVETLMKNTPQPTKLVYSPLPSSSNIILAENKAHINLMIKVNNSLRDAMNTPQIFCNKEDIPPGTKIIPLMAIYKISRTPDPEIAKVKCKTVVSGQHMNRHAYLHADCPPGIYVSFPKTISSGRLLYAELKKALYGMPNSGKLFNDHLHNIVTNLGYIRSDVDPCAYIKFLDNNHFIMFIVYVDDICVMGPTIQLIKQHYLEPLSKSLRMTDQGAPKRYLSIEINHVNDQHTPYVELNQKSYINQLVQKFNITRNKPIPISTTATVSEPVSPASMDKDVLQLVGSLRYLADHTRPDILYATNRATTDPTGTLARYTFEYLRGSTDENLKYVYSPNGIRLHGYADASWKNFPGCLSFYSFAIFLNDCSGTIESQVHRITSTVPQSIME